MIKIAPGILELLELDLVRIDMLDEMPVMHIISHMGFMLLPINAVMPYVCLQELLYVYCSVCICCDLPQKATWVRRRYSSEGRAARFFSPWLGFIVQYAYLAVLVAECISKAVSMAEGAMATALLLAMSQPYVVCL